MKRAMRLAATIPIPPIVLYEFYHPTFLINKIVIDEIAIPRKLAADRNELAVVLFSGGKMSDTNEYAIGSMAELMAPWRNLKQAKSANEGMIPVPSYIQLSITKTETINHLRFPLLVN